ncbi:MAG TPA: hypothetical protein VN656_13095 [Stellaceae bacterium]|nr:hypothetical protein [Stellaceae bacterium]
MGVLREEFPRCSKRIAIAILNDRIGADELTARAEVIAAILHFAPPSGD